MPSEAKSRIRCAIYTRKSSEEGLEQSFNSLEAQREACEAFIASQRHEGWRAIGAIYNDGGYSGGTIERPALKRLLADAGAGKIDTVVVYKVDRLTRALSDFAKIIEIFDAHKVSFVSVTQQFNTTTSMGRLTLNVLLSFAQFECEVTGERIRDKIAASKRKGMWMGGRVPLGYDLKGRKLVINSHEAECARDIFCQYLRLGCVSKLKVHLDQEGIRTKKRMSQTGRAEGGASYSRGALYKILQNRIYLGEIAHRGQVYSGEHEGVIPRDLWDKVQQRLQGNNHANRSGSRALAPSLLVGLVYDDRDNRFTPSHTVKNGKRYRYYVSQAAIKHPGDQHGDLVRIPAGELETAISSALRSFLTSAENLTIALGMRKKNVETHQKMVDAAEELKRRLMTESPLQMRAFINTLVSRIVVRRGHLEVLVRKQALQNLIGRSTANVRSQSGSGLFSLNVNAHLRRAGRETRLVLAENTAEQSPGRPAHSLIKAIARAHDWYERIAGGELRNRRSIARMAGLDERYVSRILRSAFLAPDIVESILEGRQPVGITLDDLVADLPYDWEAQRHRLGFIAK